MIEFTVLFSFSSSLVSTKGPVEVSRDITLEERISRIDTIDILQDTVVRSDANVELSIGELSMIVSDILLCRMLITVEAG